MSVAVSVKHLGAIPVESILKIRPTDAGTLLCDEIRERGEVQHFHAKHSRMLMAWSNEGQHYHNAERHPSFTSVIVKVDP